MNSTGFVILTTQRSGSGWLRDVLDRHPEITSYSELFLEYGRGFMDSARHGPDDIEYFESWFPERFGGGGRIARARAARPFLGQLYESGANRAVGFKLMYSQMRRNPAVAAYIARRKLRVIHLVRTNSLDLLISDATSKARGQAHAWEGEEVKQAKVSLEPRTTITQLRKLELQKAIARRFLRVCRLPTLELRYENLMSNAEGFKDAVAFLDVSREWSPISSMQRLNRVAKEDLVENWSELSEALASTRYSRFIAD